MPQGAIKKKKKYIFNLANLTKPLHQSKFVNSLGLFPVSELSFPFSDFLWNLRNKSQIDWKDCAAS